ncbi:MAG: hypothetical protein IIW48_04600, partial [Clostridia bacterium]|nr:hypothetical protein [Clostridia bacterium]
MNKLFATRQIVALKNFGQIPAAMLKAIFKFDFKRVIALIIAAFQLLGMFLLDTPVTPYKSQLDMSKFTD